MTVKGSVFRLFAGREVRWNHFDSLIKPNIFIKETRLNKVGFEHTSLLLSARFVDRFGKRKHKRFKKLQECRAWIADATYVDEHSDISMPSDMLVDQWFDYWIGIKKKTVRSNTVRNYTERYIKNIKPVIGKMTLSDVKPLQCQKIFYDMADQGYRTSTIYQARIALYNMFEYAKENEVLCSNPCKKSVKSDFWEVSRYTYHPGKAARARWLVVRYPRLTSMASDFALCVLCEVW